MKAHPGIICVDLLLGMVSVPGASAQEMQFENFSVEQGISHPTVTSIVQDKRGFLWFGTNDGLNRFDGYNVTVFTQDPRDTTSLSNSNITCLLADDDGTLWIGTMGGGLNAFDDRTGTFTHYSGPGLHIWSLCRSHDGILWVGSDGLTGYAGSPGTGLHEVPHTFSFLNGSVVRALREDRNGNLWAGTWFDGVFQLGQDGECKTSFRNIPGDPMSLSENHVISIHQDIRGDMWFGTYTAGLNRLAARKAGFTRYSRHPEVTGALNDNTIRTILEQKEGMLWLGTAGGGLNILDMNTGIALHVVHDARHPSSIAGNDIRVIYRDNAGTVWCGSEGGVSKYSLRRSRFRLIEAGPATFPDPVGALCEDHMGNLWFANYGKGITRYDRHAGTYSFFRAAEHRGPGSAFITSLLADSGGMIWIGTVGGGLGRLDPRTATFRTFAIGNADSATAGNTVHVIHEGAGGKIWIGTSGGIALREPAAGKFRYFGRYAGSGHAEGNLADVVSIMENPDGTLWVGTEFAGLFLFDQHRGILRRFTHDVRDSGSIGSDNVAFLYRTRSRDLWIGTDGNGLDRFDPESGDFHHLREEDGLLSNAVQGILEDDQGRLWVMSPRGVSCVRPETGGIRRYDASDGLLRPAYNACVLTRSGEMAIGSDRGVYFFTPGDFPGTAHLPPMILTSFHVLNEPWPLAHPIYCTPEIVLDYSQNFFSFEFASLDFAAPEKNRYAYFLEGVDDGWVQAGGKRYANYTHIDPGSYVFHVKGTNSDGVWNDTGTSITLVITPPFWETWWFRSLVALGMVVLLMLAHDYRVRKLLEVERVRVRIAQDLHDELGSNLSGIALASRMIQESDNLTRKQRERLAEISENATQTAETIRDIVWFINPTHDEPGELLTRMREIAVAMLATVRVSFEGQDDAFAGVVDAGQRRQVFLIFKEILTNIARHAGCSHVRISLERVGTSCRLTVSDDGRGFDPCAACHGNGLRNMRSRAERIGGTLTVTSTPASGTTVLLTTGMT